MRMEEQNNGLGKVSQKRMNDDILENILKDTNQAIFLLQPNGRITNTSQEAKRIFGITDDISFNTLVQDERNDGLSEFIIESV